jgi:hypothetical protein
MSRLAAKTVCLVAGLFCLVALADGRNLTVPMWKCLMPPVLLPRRLSASESQMSGVQARREVIRREIAETEEARQTCARRRDDLMGRLRAQIAGKDVGEMEVEQIMKADPVTAALVRSIDAEGVRGENLNRRAAEQNAEMVRLDARIIALQSGVSLTERVEPERPSDHLRPEGSQAESEAARYADILKQAKGASGSREGRQ